MRRLNILYLFVFTFGFFTAPFIKGEVPVAAGIYTSDQQKKDKKKSKKAEPGQGLVREGNTGMLIDAKKEAIIGNLKTANDLFRKYINRYPDDPVGYFELAKLEAEQTNFTEAVRLCRLANKLDQDNIWYSLFLAELCQITSQLNEAIDIYENIVEKNPGNLDYLYQLAALYLQTEKYQDAIKIYNQIDARAGVSEEVTTQKQKIYMHLKDLNGAEREIQKLIKAFPDEPRYYSILAEFYMSNKMFDKALVIYQKIAAMEPDNAYIHMSMADYYRKTGNKEKAFEELKLGFANPNLDVDTKINILLSFYTVNQIYNDLKDQAFILSKILIDTHPKNAKVFSIYGDLLVQDNKIREARETFLKVLSLDSSRYAVWEQVLQLDLQTSEYEHLLTYSKKAVELFPFQPLPFLFSGLANLQLKKNDAALKDFAAGANLVVDNNELLAQFYMYQGDALHAMKNDTEAYMAYERSLKMKDDNAYVLNNYAYYLSLEGRELEKAEKMSKKAVAIDPENASFQDTYGWVLFKQQKYKEAAEWILKAVQSKEEPNAEVLEHYGDVLYKLGDMAGALEYWLKAKKKGQGSDLLEKKIIEKKYYQ
ncbi:MAG: tetratricopeptide repeat protein [Bacteroidales bacterium]|nr:tetratricopeptide repeat protein [Bacteroidales bacterium]